jgi:TolA-binding protein
MFYRRKWLSQEAILAIPQKRLESMKAPDGSRWISLDDIEREQQTKPRSASPVRYQLKQVQSLVAELQETLHMQEHRIQHLEQQIAVMQEHPLQEPLLIHLSPQEEMQEGSSTFSLTEITQLVAKQLATGYPSSHQRPQGVAGMIARRHLPEGTMRLVDFAHQHEISVHAIKKGYYEHAFALTVHQRAGTVKRNHQEWWISQEQHQPVIAYCQQHAIPYVPCPHCQDNKEEQQVG